ncbi:MAG TPA: class I SAM-dependent methyltransferase [Bradyrhizobium sp.]|nr:class I SAM-dependent methyltransferase [Bradyrhizobium sp.]
MNKLRGIEFDKAVGFDEPTQLPRDEAQHRDWQAANREWWEARPMRYDWREEIATTPGTLEFFREVDRRFLSSVRSYMPWRTLPFDQIIPFETLHERDVLEIGVGQGTHAQLLASQCRLFIGIDLTAYATRMTARRLLLTKLPRTIVQMDAERLAFADASFDYIWSWGVIHHSADTRRVLREMHRVLRDKGECTIMVYYRSWWHFYVCGFFRGIFQDQFRKRGSLHHVTQGATDGAIARYYSQAAWREAMSGLFAVESARIFGQKAEIVPIPGGRLKRLLERVIPDRLARLMTNTLQMGSFLVVNMRKL